MFMGEFQHSLDDKNRIVIPSNFRDVLGSEFIITRGLEKCLYVYTKNSWDALVKKLSSLPFTKKDARIFVRSLFSAAANCNIDKQGRISISSNHVSYAELKKECVIIGANDRVELWSKENWDNFNLEYSDALESIAEDLFSGDDYAL